MRHDEALRLRILRLERALGADAGRATIFGCAALAVYERETAEDMRETKDVDFVLDLPHLTRGLRERLEAAGIREVFDADSRSKYRLDDGSGEPPFELDLLFSDDALAQERWLADGIRAPFPVQLDGELHAIRAVAPMHFIALKLLADAERGNSEGKENQDLEDVVDVLLHVRGTLDAVESSGEPIALYLRDELRRARGLRLLDKMPELVGHSGEAQERGLELQARLRRILTSET